MPSEQNLIDAVSKLDLRDIKFKGQEVNYNLVPKIFPGDFTLLTNPIDTSMALKIGKFTDGVSTFNYVTLVTFEDTLLIQFEEEDLIALDVTGINPSYVSWFLDRADLDGILKIILKDENSGTLKVLTLNNSNNTEILSIEELSIPTVQGSWNENLTRVCYGCYSSKTISRPRSLVDSGIFIIGVFSDAGGQEQIGAISGTNLQSLTVKRVTSLNWQRKPKNVGYLTPLTTDYNKITSGLGQAGFPVIIMGSENGLLTTVSIGVADIKFNSILEKEVWLNHPDFGLGIDEVCACAWYTDPKGSAVHVKLLDGNKSILATYLASAWQGLHLAD